ncbi:GAF and ANTAR domain-containing protein [Streptomyces sp. Ru73]|uniref:GAF and ANTAR domain-containing protein n=1 Tax=Streptomyces sp. Ru73 TaxID=2080748 RepID=UPI0011B0947B|nr:GAF and ANTAR domain-containing protein [Streptomyces sp. Ru73]
MKTADLVLEVMRRLLDETVAEETALQWAAEQSTRRLGGCAAGVLLADRGDGLRTAAATSSPAHALQQVAAAHGEGPGPECIRRGESVLVPDLSATEARWPEYARTAKAAGIGAAGSFPLHHHNGGPTLGALNLFDARPGAMPGPRVAAAQDLADALALGLRQRRKSQAAHCKIAQLQQALTSRVLIEQAKGMLAERWQTDVQTAFDVLRKYARAQQLRLVKVAGAVVERRPGAGPPAADRRQSGGSER